MGSQSSGKKMLSSAPCSSFRRSKLPSLNAIKRNSLCGIGFYCNDIAIQQCELLDIVHHVLLAIKQLAVAWWRAFQISMWIGVWLCFLITSIPIALAVVEVIAAVAVILVQIQVALTDSINIAALVSGGFHPDTDRGFCFVCSGNGRKGTLKRKKKTTSKKGSGEKKGDKQQRMWGNEGDMTT
ncbi:hypothetical protein DFJ73DRAFT_414526 [Zopfochytrium polystomum]|nr:hypothetical protein DFJ73DRAFT_414526 [Zopfochytrium polystomum]